MLIDDNGDDNFYHERVIRKNEVADTVILKQTGLDALEYLKSNKNIKENHPNLILLDINMPGMNGWEFIEEYIKIDKQLQSHAVVVMLSTSDNPDDKIKAKFSKGVSDFKTKPLTREKLEDIITKFFS